MTADPAQFIPGQDGVYYPANRTATRLSRERKKLALNKADLVEIKLAGTPVTLMNGEPIPLEVTA